MSAIVKKSEAKEKDVVLPRAETYSRASKPIVLSSQRFNKIVNNATTTDSSKAAAEAKEILEYKEKLKAGNDELVAQFKGNMQRTQEEKLQQIKEQMDKKTKQGKKPFSQYKTPYNFEDKNLLDRMKEPFPKE